MFKKRLPETNKTSNPQTRQTAKERGPGILAERFPAISNIISRSKDTLVKGVMELENKKIRDKGYTQIQRNLSSLGNMQALAEEQNDLLQQIIRALREQDDTAPDQAGGRGRPPRARAPGRGRFGQRARARLQRMRAARRAQRIQRVRAAVARPYTAVRRATATGIERARAAVGLADRARPMAAAARVEPTIQRPTDTDRAPTAPADDADKTRTQADADRIKAEADEQARRTIAQADEQAKRITSDAEERAGRIIADAEERAKVQTQEADAIRSRAQADADAIRNAAQSEADSIKSRANAEAERIRNSVQAAPVQTPEAARPAPVAPIPEPDALRAIPEAARPAPVAPIPEPDALRTIPEAARPVPVTPIPEPDALRATAEQRPAVALADAARVAAPPTQTPDQARVQSSGGIRTAGVGAVTGAVAGTPGGTAATGAATGAGLAVAIGGIDNIIARRFANVTMRNIPVVGSAVSGVSAISRVMAGDVRGAAMDASSIGLDIARAFGIAAAATGVGAAVAAGATTTQLGLTIATLTRDVFNEVYEKAYGIPPYRDTEENVRVRSPEIQEKIATSITDFLRSQQPALGENVGAAAVDDPGSFGLEPVAPPATQVQPPPPAAAAAPRTGNMLSRLFSRSSGSRQPQQAQQEVATTPAQKAPVEPEPQPIAEPRPDTQDLVTRLSSGPAAPMPKDSDDYKAPSESMTKSPITTTAKDEVSPVKDPAPAKEDTEAVAAEPIVRSLLREEEIESALPYPENLIDMIGKTEFENIEIDAEKIVFDGEIKLAQREYAVLEVARAQPTVAAQVPIATEVSDPQAPAPTSDATQTSAAPVATTGGTETPAAPAAAAEPQAASAPSLATPVALPSPAATGIAPAAQPQAAPAPQQSAPSAPQQQGSQGGAGAGDFMTQVNEVSGRLGINPANLLAVMRSESSLNPRAVNSSTGASGLIQFMPRTAQSLGTSVEAIRQMSAAEQMPFVERFFRSVRLPAGASAGKLYAYVFLPGRANREVLTQSGENFYEANRGLDVDRDGKITIADLDARLMRFGAVGGAGTATMQAAAPGAGGALAAAGAGMAAADQAQARSGGQTMIVQARNQQAAQQPNVVPPQAAGAEVPLNTRLQKQVA